MLRRGYCFVHFFCAGWNWWQDPLVPKFASHNRWGHTEEERRRESLRHRQRALAFQVAELLLRGKWIFVVSQCHWFPPIDSLLRSGFYSALVLRFCMSRVQSMLRSSHVARLLYQSFAVDRLEAIQWALFALRSNSSQKPSPHVTLIKKPQGNVRQRVLLGLVLVLNQ